MAKRAFMALQLIKSPYLCVYVLHFFLPSPFINSLSNLETKTIPFPFQTHYLECMDVGKQ
jgi:hypothetical protein